MEVEVRLPLDFEVGLDIGIFLDIKTVSNIRKDIKIFLISQLSFPLIREAEKQYNCFRLIIIGVIRKECRFYFLTIDNSENFGNLFRKKCEGNNDCKITSEREAKIARNYQKLSDYKII